MEKESKEEIKRIRKLMQMSRPAFGAVCIGRSKQTVDFYERGLVNPPKEVLANAKKWEKLYKEIHCIED